MVRKYYPVAAEGLVIDDVLPEPAPVDGMRAVLGWEDVNRSRRDVRTVVTNYLGSYWLLPAARPAGETLSPLLLWWCLLYAFSDLARYHPAEWTAALNPNGSSAAVPIERTLLALSVIPRLVLITLVPGAYARG
jgi:hypothetical protein